MKSFNEFCNEMAISSGKRDIDAFSRKSDWDLYYKNANKPLRDKIGSEHLKLYKVQNTYFLTTEEDNYLGYIHLEYVSDKIYKINSSSSNMKGGFYNIVFVLLLSLDAIDEILSDNDLSENAISAYNNLLKNKNLKVQIKSNDEYFEFSKEKIVQDTKYRVSVKEASYMHIKEKIIEYYRRISLTEGSIRSTYKMFYDERNKELNPYLFGEE